MKKENVGKGLKKIARIIPGVGSYQDREDLREADKGLREEISRRLDELLGVLEWLKTDQAKKGGWKRLKPIDDLSRDIEKVSRLVERAERGYAPVFEGRTVTEETLAELFEYDKGLFVDLEEIETLIHKMTDSGIVPEETVVTSVREKMRAFENRINRRGDLFKE